MQVESARSGRQTALTSLTKDQIKALSGVFQKPNGIFFINPTTANNWIGSKGEYDGWASELLQSRPVESKK